ncbi:DUF3152 domain-containing protein [Kitasatospora sp. NPDC002227]|uniref:DUF3152 domain-containing protein n=1 Tax=Kitasatospora sp. NPDC002227 TaxID=3154773 RepID=UPI00331B7115
MPVRLRRRAIGAALAILLLTAAVLVVVDLNARHRAAGAATARLALTRVATLQSSFTVAEANGPAVGHGTLRRYRVEVEHGVGVDPQAAATQVQNILADKRSWTADGQDSFQLVSAEPFDFTVRIASPQLVDKICGAAGLDTKGEVNCDVERQVMVNAKRWQSGSPQFTGSLDDYRALIVNHEVGHRIGHGHESCPGPGQPAPAMMQQIYGLNGCLPNAWPYSPDGRYLGGPPSR